VKAIDLESLTPRGEPLRDFSPETLAPEHAALISQGSLKMKAPGDFKLGTTKLSVDSIHFFSLLAQRLCFGLCCTDLPRPIFADPKADIFALGVEILQLFMGRFTSVLT